VAFLLELILEVVWLFLVEVIAGALWAFLTSAFPRLSQLPIERAAVVCSISAMAGFAAGTMSLSVAPSRVWSAPVAAVFAWTMLPLLGGVAMWWGATRVRRGGQASRLWFLAGVIFGLAYLATRLVIPR
jgi:hypothetical protein